MTTNNDAYVTDTFRPRDFKAKYRLVHFSHFWNYESNNDLKRIETRLKVGYPPQFLILVGPPGSGKTCLAYMMGMWASCMAWKSNPLWCGNCETCVYVMNGRSDVRCGFCEVDAAANDAMDKILHARNKTRTEVPGLVPNLKGDDHWGPNSSNQRMSVTLIDEAQHFGPRVQEQLLKLSDKWWHGVIVLATTELERIIAPIKSRATILSLKPPTIADASAALIRIAECEGRTLHMEAACEIARRANGAPRSCLGMLEEILCVSDKERDPVTVKEVLQCFGNDAEHCPVVNTSSHQGRW